MPDATWLDRAIAWMSPNRGVRRLQARKMIEVLAGYEGARVGRRTEGWVTSSTGADAVGELDWSRLRDRARDLVRNNPYAARAIDVKTSHTIGTGIIAEVKSKRLEPLWQGFVEGCDADGDADLYGVLAQIERCRMESGECLVRFVRTGRISESPIPTQLRVLEPDYLDSSRDLNRSGGNEVRHGIERDANGRAVAYWLYPEHPGDRSSAGRIWRRGLSSERVPAEDVIHVYRRLRPGQTRGITDFAPVMLRMRDLDDYDDAEIMRKKIEACLAAFVTSPQGVDSPRLGPVSTDEKGRIEALFPGMIEYLRAGEAITFAEPKALAGYEEFQRIGLRAIAAGVGIPYELMTGDLSNVNYSSSRVGLVDFRRRIEQEQWLLYVPRVCRRVERRFLGDVQSMRPGLGDRTVFDWTPPRFELIDPMKETQADLEAVLSGFETWDEIVRRRGWSADEQLQVIADWMEKLDEMGVVLKSDPRTQIKSAATPTAPTSGDEPDENAEAAEAA